MKNYWLIFCLFFFTSCSKESTISLPDITPATIEVLSVKTFGGSNNDVIKSVTHTADGGYITLGYTQSNNGDITSKNDTSFDFWVMKFSGNNTLLWSKIFGGSDDDRGEKIIETTDGGYAILGYSQSIDKNISSAGSKDFLLIKLTKNGSISWQKTFGFKGSDYGITLIQTKDNGYLITGVLDITASDGQGNSKSANIKHAGGDVWVIKLNNSGNLEWSKYFGGSFTDTPFGVVETQDNSYLIAASSDSDDFNISNNKGSYDFWILKIASDGKLIWEKSFGGSEIDEARGIATTNEGDFIIVGDTRSSDKDVTLNNGAADIWMLKITSDGNLIWQKSIGASGFETARSITKTQDNGFLIAGSSRSTDNGFINKGQNDALILKIDNNGNLLWKKTIGGSEIDFLYDIKELNNNSIVAVGESKSADKDITKNKGFTDALILKLKEK
ncbi:hypothetical protein [Polaribacter aquimarinus]|uniref:Bulb-type lectin domain-containing protein n=1 Tax=Polaribacter aquimarinus TaxID=2100726 RepID=A0A2U2JBX6_9FLAO|nr:hypothetical protein [Polaribacter aquimarinus]PWG05843.1 hypothetical protein DIS07_05220 [Polaribacter aquimarinus]